MATPETKIRQPDPKLAEQAALKDIEIGRAHV